MKIEDAKFYCIVEVGKDSGEVLKQEIFSGDDLETLAGIDKVRNFAKEEHNAKTAMIIFIQKLKD